MISLIALIFPVNNGLVLFEFKLKECVQALFTIVNREKYSRKFN